jgi:Flp pilus assembly protein TadD
VATRSPGIGKRDLDRAAADYGEVTKLAPADAQSWHNRGMIRLHQGDARAAPRNKSHLLSRQGEQDRRGRALQAGAGFLRVPQDIRPDAAGSGSISELL